MRKLVFFCLCAIVFTVQSCTETALEDDAVQVDKEKIVRPGNQ